MTGLNKKYRRMKFWVEMLMNIWLRLQTLFA